ncbi:hypothetical protein D3C86_2263710 [compost metagenome]
MDGTESLGNHGDILVGEHPGVGFIKQGTNQDEGIKWRRLDFHQWLRRRRLITFNFDGLRG